MRIAVSAVQGAFIEHEQMLSSLGVECFELRQRADLLRSFDGLVLPGGESTVQGKLLRELDMFDELHQQIRSGLPVLGTCAGLILLAEQLSNDPNVYFGTLPVTVRRNAYGRQLGSFYAEESFQGQGVDEIHPRSLYRERARGSGDHGPGRRKYRRRTLSQSAGPVLPSGIMQRYPYSPALFILGWPGQQLRCLAAPKS